jgi:lipopolysaccharide transport system permease protein
VLLPLAAVLVPLVDFVVGLPVLFVLMAMYGTWPGAQVVLAPAFLALALVTALGAGFFLSSVNVRYRDVPYIIPVFLQVLPLVSGVMYAVDQLPNKWQWVLSLNPMTTVIAGWRWSVLGAAQPNWAHSAVGAGMGLIIFLLGLSVFRASEPRFADTI